MRDLQKGVGTEAKTLIVVAKCDVGGYVVTLRCPMCNKRWFDIERLDGVTLELICRCKQKFRCSLLEGREPLITVVQ